MCDSTCILHMYIEIGMAALNLVGMVNKMGVAVKFFVRGLLSTPLHEILDTPLIKITVHKIRFLSSSIWTSMS